MKSSEVCALAIQIVSFQYGEVQYRQNNTTYYPDWTWNVLTWYSGAWHSDCLGFVRACICGWHADKTVVAGGANTSYPCYNYNEQMMLNSCSSYSNNFTTIVPGELLYMTGHVGLYVGEFQLNGFTYNACEVTMGFDKGGIPSWVDPDGTRRKYRGSADTRGTWEQHGLFNLNGTDYGITEYDGGATPASTGFGTELTRDEVNYYWDTLPELTYSYVESVAIAVHGMSADVFAVMAGWGWGEAYAFAIPTGATEPDHYMAYLCDCCPVNYFEALNINTGPAMAAAIAGGDTGGYYDYSTMIARATDLEANESTAPAQAELKALLLALLNPDQFAWYCNGYPSATSTVIYNRTYPGDGTIYAFYESSSWIPYDITGTGIRGGLPDPGNRSHEGMRLYEYLRPWQHYTQYRRRVLKYGRRYK